MRSLELTAYTEPGCNGGEGGEGGGEGGEGGGDGGDDGGGGGEGGEGDEGGEGGEDGITGKCDEARLGDGDCCKGGMPSMARNTGSHCGAQATPRTETCARRRGR